MFRDAPPQKKQNKKEREDVGIFPKSRTFWGGERPLVGWSWGQSFMRSLMGSVIGSVVRLRKSKSCQKHLQL